MTSPSSLIAQLYARAQTAVSPAPPQPRAPTAPAQGFTELAQGFVQSLRASEDVARAGLAGRADPQSVVLALASSELAIETAVTLRDKVVEAYQEILRMPV